jgi:hypothetical protein
VPDRNIQLYIELNSEGATEDGHKAQGDIKNLARKMGCKIQRNCDLRQKTRTQAAWEEETRKQKLRRRDQEVLGESKKMIGVYIHETGFNFPSLVFLIRFASSASL